MGKFKKLPQNKLEQQIRREIAAQTQKAGLVVADRSKIRKMKMIHAFYGLALGLSLWALEYYSR